MIGSVLKYREEYNSDMQVICVLALEKIFIDNEIKCFKNESYLFKGVRGKFYCLDNYSMYFTFEYFSFFFEFYLIYDQLEYYISKENSILKECNLEDYTEDIDEMVETFIKYLVNDLRKLSIPCKNIEF